MKLVVRNGGCNNTPGCRTPSKSNRKIIFAKKPLPWQKVATEQFSINLTVPWKCSDIPNMGTLLEWRARGRRTAALQKNPQLFPGLPLTKTNSSSELCPVLQGGEPSCRGCPAPQQEPVVPGCSRSLSSRNSSPGTARCAQAGDCSGTRHKRTRGSQEEHSGCKGISLQKTPREFLSCPKQHQVHHPWPPVSHPSARDRPERPQSL